MAKKKKDGLNKKLLHKMTETAMPMERDKPRLHLTGPEAKAVHKMKPGSMVSMQVHGKVTNIGLMQYGPEKGSPQAEIEVERVKLQKRGFNSKPSDDLK